MRGPGWLRAATPAAILVMLAGATRTGWEGKDGLRTPAPALKRKYSIVRMKLDGSRGWDDLTGLEPTGGVSNYYPGNDAKAWRTNIPITAASVPAAYTKAWIWSSTIKAASSNMTLW